uniref:DUF1409 domain-containing protein n=2 Tax=Oryza sativa subsp. japonica TaxID=39947 RepID=Q53RL6_ORYSJ|nr:Hypothetical protein-related [Oryza sativa Japonica Group]ABF97132.1 hypothetical protein LOC_Os03g36580 [Oryza sativa Japonica Group]
MSSSASPSAAPSAEYAEHLSNLIAIPSLSHENHYFLGPIGNLDSTDFIIGETNRIPFRLANPNLSHWKNTFKSWPSLEKTTPEKSWITWYQRVSANKKVHWDEIGIGQALDLTIANLAKDEPLMAAASYFWSNTINAFLFNQGPMTPTLIDITMITGPLLGSIDNIELAGFRSKNFDRWWGEWKLHLFHQSASMYMTDLFPDVIPQKKKTAVKKKPAATIVKSAPPVLADLFSFDIRDYLDKAEEDTSSKALAPLSDDLEASSLDSLVVDCGSIRTRLHEVQALIPEELADVLTPAAYLEQHQFKLEKAKLRLAERRERKEIEATIQVNRQLVHEEKVKLDQLSEGPIKSNIDRLEAHKIDLLAQLEECNAELDMEHKKLADLPKSIKEQKARLKSTIKNVADLTKSLKVISGTDAQDAQAIEEVEQIRLSSSTYLNNSCVIGPRNFCNRLRCLNTPLF